MLLWNHKISDGRFETIKNCEIFCLSDNISFATLDGFICFLLNIVNYELTLSFCSEISFYLKKINRYLSKLFLKNIVILENEDFKSYCKRVSNVLRLKMNYKEIRRNKGLFINFENCDFSNHFLFVIRKSDYYSKNQSEYVEDADFKAYVEKELLTEIQNMSISVSTQSGTYLSVYNCHVEICYALRILINLFIYLCNSTSHKKNELFLYDKLEIDKRFRIFEETIKHIKNVCYSC